MRDERVLYVLRHAKSSWDDPGQDDHERPLAPRGRRAVTLLGQYIVSNEIEPDLVLCSSARRTRDTLAGIDIGGLQVIDRALYDASCLDLMARLRTVDPEVSSVMVIGHNPALQMLVLKLVGPRPEGVEANLAEIARKFPTGALATLTLTCDWSQLAPGCGELSGYVRPKALLYH
jgi:phosphohistidine phosphatase